MAFGCDASSLGSLGQTWSEPPPCLPATGQRWRRSTEAEGWVRGREPLLPECSPCGDRRLVLEDPVLVPASAEAAHLSDAALLGPGVVLVAGYQVDDRPQLHVVERSGRSSTLTLVGDDPGHFGLGAFVSTETPGRWWALGRSLLELQLIPAADPERAELTARSSTISFVGPYSMALGARSASGDPIFLGPDGSVRTVRSDRMLSLHPGFSWPDNTQVIPDLLTLADRRLLAIGPASSADRKIGEYAIIDLDDVEVARVRDGKHVQAVAQGPSEIYAVLVEEGGGTLGTLEPGGAFLGFTAAPRNTYRLAMLEGQVIMTTRDNTLQRVLLDPITSCEPVPLQAIRRILPDGDALALVSADAFSVTWAYLAPPTGCALSP